MGGSTHHCIVCDRRQRVSRSLFMTIECRNQERRIKEGLFKRHRHPIDDDLIGKQVHRTCYKRIIWSTAPGISTARKNPRKYARVKRSKASSSIQTNHITTDPIVVNKSMLLIPPVFHDTDNQSENQQDNKENIDRLFHIGLDHNYCVSSSFNSDHPEPITRQYTILKTNVSNTNNPST